MDAMTMAKKKIYQDLIASMHKKMAEAGMPVPESAEPEVEVESDAGDEVSEADCMPEDSAKKGLTISLATIRKAPKAMLKASSEGLPSSLEMALMGKEKNKFKKA